MDKKSKISVVLAVINEEANLERCLRSVSGLADEIVIVDGGSTDRTVEIARKFTDRIIKADNPLIFHINKQKGLIAARYDWILQLDADEEVTPQLSAEIISVVAMTDRARRELKITGWKNRLFVRHQQVLVERDGQFYKKSADIAAYFIPRLNFFLGGPITHAGTYPDGVIRLVRNGRARFPCRSVHEQIQIDGGVSWLYHDLNHYSNPSLQRYISGARRYTDLVSHELKNQRESRSLSGFINYLLLKPIETFLRLYFRHKGVLDGWRGLLFCLFSALHHPVSFIKYLRN